MKYNATVGGLFVCLPVGMHTPPNSAVAPLIAQKAQSGAAAAPGQSLAPMDQQSVLHELPAHQHLFLLCLLFIQQPHVHYRTVHYNSILQLTGETL